MNNVILNIFDVESEAFQSFNELKNFKQTENTKIAQIALVQNVEGRITVKDFYNFVDSANEEALKGTLIGALIGIIGGPLGMLFGASLGGLGGLTIGTSVDTTEASLVQYIANKLPPNETAIIALVEEKDEEVINALFSKYKTQIVPAKYSVCERLKTALKLSRTEIEVFVKSTFMSIPQIRNAKRAAIPFILQLSFSSSASY